MIEPGQTDLQKLLERRAEQAKPVPPPPALFTFSADVIEQQQGYKQRELRLIADHLRVNREATKLNGVIMSDSFSTFDREEQILQLRQHACLVQLVTVLEQRIRRFRRTETDHPPV